MPPKSTALKCAPRSLMLLNVVPLRFRSSKTVRERFERVKREPLRSFPVTSGGSALRSASCLLSSCLLQNEPAQQRMVRRSVACRSIESPSFVHLVFFFLIASPMTNHTTPMATKAPELPAEPLSVMKYLSAPTRTEIPASMKNAVPDRKRLRILAPVEEVVLSIRRTINSPALSGLRPCALQDNGMHLPPVVSQT